MQLVLLTALGVGGATFIGALIGFAFKKISHRFSDIVLSFAAGIMLAAAILGLILPSLEYGDKWINYRENAIGGDPIYVEHILRRLDDGTELMVKLPDGSTISTTIFNVANIEDYSLSVRRPR